MKAEFLGMPASNQITISTLIIDNGATKIVSQTHNFKNVIKVYQNYFLSCYPVAKWSGLRGLQVFLQYEYNFFHSTGFLASRRQ